jgi:hypothetical protein
MDVTPEDEANLYELFHGDSSKVSLAARSRLERQLNLCWQSAKLYGYGWNLTDEGKQVLARRKKARKVQREMVR